MRVKVTKALLAAVSLCALLHPVAASACTGLMLHDADGSIVHGRTAEFAMPLDLSFAVLPAGTAFTGTAPNGAGLSYKAKYAAFGITTFHEQALIDGMNEKGLAAGGFYFPTFAYYAPVTPATQGKALAPSEFVNFLVTQFATVAEVRAALEAGEVVIAPTILKAWGPEPAPFHYIVYDKTGAALVIEPVKEGLKLYDSPMGVMTNSPGYDWHMTNLRNYIALRALDVPAVTIDRTSLAPVGQGNGMLGLPGDFTPPSRFVRASAFAATAVPPANSDAGVNDLLHILNNFDIPKGVSREKDGSALAYDITLMTGVRDPQKLRYYWRTRDDQTLRMMDLKEALARLKAAGGPPKLHEFGIEKTTPVIVDMTGQMPTGK